MPRQPLVRLASCSFGRSLLGGRNWTEQAFGAADERIAALVEAEELIGSAGDPDSNALDDGAGAMLCHAEPERAGSAKIDAVVAAVDLKSGGETAGTAR